MASLLSRTALAACLSLCACGAKTGLLVPDATVPEDLGADAVDALDVVDAPDVSAACRTGRFNLMARAADLLLVIDRSRSMEQGLDGGRGGTSKWQILRGALASTLPGFQDQVNVGALFYPEPGADTRTATCSFPNVPTVDIEPAVRTANAVVAAIDANGPGGSTPTAAALLRAYTWIVRHPSRSRARYIVVATDGAPDCNASLDPRTCTCVGGGGGCRSAEQCLDATRTISVVRQIATNPITTVPVFVIGIAGAANPQFVSTLTAMAVEGGRPQRTAGGAPTYYDVRQASDLPAAFTAIQNAVARCTYVTPSRPTDTDGITLSLDGATIPYDPSRVNGWDWTDRAFGEITLFGDACPANASPTTVVTATVQCRDR